MRRAVTVILAATACAFPAFVFLIGENTDFHMALWGRTYVVALFGSTVFTVLENRGSGRLAVLRSGAAEFVARISYALYLVHISVLIFVFLTFRTERTIKTFDGAALTALALALALALSVLICFASYRLFEGPLIRIAHRKFRFDEAFESVDAGTRAAAGIAAQVHAE
jgi:peptidoglycan/LPS O-acetylase OafA/YrhL